MEFANVVRGARNDPSIGSSDFSNDSMAVYSHALQWWMTGKQVHAEESIEILNAWSSTLKTIGATMRGCWLAWVALDSATRQSLSGTPTQVGAPKIKTASSKCSGTFFI